MEGLRHDFPIKPLISYDRAVLARPSTRFDRTVTNVGLMRYLSICSGIEAATVAGHPLGWIPAAFSDIEAFQRALAVATRGSSKWTKVIPAPAGDECQNIVAISILEAKEMAK